MTTLTPIDGNSRISPRMNQQSITHLLSTSQPPPIGDKQPQPSWTSLSSIFTNTTINHPHHHRQYADVTSRHRASTTETPDNGSVADLHVAPSKGNTTAQQSYPSPCSQRICRHWLEPLHPSHTVTCRGRYMSHRFRKI
jgi:hypothetical protein